MEDANECLKKSAESVTLGEIKKLDSSIQNAKQGPTSQGNYDEAIFLHNSFKSDGLRRMSSDEFERASDEAEGLNDAEDQEEKHKPVLATSEKTACYKEFDDVPVRIEGPEYSQDYTYFLVDKLQDLKNLEMGISLEQFEDKLFMKRIELEFRTL